MIAHQPKIWIPEFAVLNAEDRWRLRNRAEKLFIQSNGYTSFDPNGVMRTECKFDLSLFPFDVQFCQIIIEDWRYSTRYVDLRPGIVGYKLLRVSQLEQWTVTQGDHLIFHSNYTGFRHYSRAHFTVVLTRKPGYYVITSIIPTIFISLSELVTFSIPVKSPTRLELSFTCLLAYGVFQTHASVDLPRSADNPPLLSVYILIMSGFIFITTCYHGVAGSCYQNKPNLKKRILMLDRTALFLYAFLVIATPITFLVIIPASFSKYEKVI